MDWLKSSPHVHTMNNEDPVSTETRSIGQLSCLGIV